MRRPLLVALNLTIFLAAACASIDKEALKQFYAPDFRSFDDTLLQDSMWRLGRGVQDLDDAFKAEGVSDDERHARILASLELMAEAAAQANAPGQKKSHENIAMNIDVLVGDIAAAKTAAEAKSYELAQAIPQTCLHCHEGGGGGPQTTATPAPTN
jgi:hypothetical protein